MVYKFLVIAPVKLYLKHFLIKASVLEKHKVGSKLFSDLQSELILLEILAFFLERSGHMFFLLHNRNGRILNGNGVILWAVPNHVRILGIVNDILDLQVFRYCEFASPANLCAG